MKIAITADVHLRNKNGCPERYNALENIFQQMNEEKIGTLFIAGDLFDREFSNYADFEKLCSRYPGIQLHIIPGNHDSDISGRSIVGDNIRIYTSPTVLEIDSICFLFIPYAEQAGMGDRIAEKLKEIEGKKWIFVGHGDYLSGARQVNPLESGTYMPISDKDLERFSPGKVFLGHIHKGSSLGRVYYAGSPCGMDISETGKRRFLIYDTGNDKVEHRTVLTDVLYCNEDFVIIPVEKEAALLQSEINRRVAAWGIDPAEYPKIQVRVEARGYAVDRNRINQILIEGFRDFTFYKGELPKISELSTGSDTQRNAVAQRIMELIEDLNWNFSGDEPSKDQTVMAALSAIYGD
jgi:DNA repair exonuclease SbcCD nuclease subunit